MTTSTTRREDPSIRAGHLALRAAALGLTASGAIVLLVLASGLVPAGVRPFLLCGFGLAALTGTTGVAALSYTATLPATDDRTVQMYLLGLVGNLLLQFAAVGLGLLAVFWIDEKFPSLLAFGIAFAGTATLLQTAGALVISSALRARARGFASGVSEARDPGQP